MCICVTGVSVGSFPLRRVWMIVSFDVPAPRPADMCFWLIRGSFARVHSWGSAGQRSTMCSWLAGVGCQMSDNVVVVELTRILGVNDFVDEHTHLVETMASMNFTGKMVAL